MADIAVQTTALIMPTIAATPPGAAGSAALPTPVPAPVSYGYPARVHALDRNGTLQRGAVAIQQAGPAEGTGAYVVHGATGARYYITGTDRAGRYVGAHTITSAGVRTDGVSGAPGLFIRTPSEMVQLLQLRPISGQPGRYMRDGFTGTYTLQFESDGSVSAFYSGGAHRSNAALAMPPQTFHHGVWDMRRQTALSTPEVCTAIERARRENTSRANRVGTEVLACTTPAGTNLFNGRTDGSAGGTGYYTTDRPSTGITLHMGSDTIIPWTSHPLPPRVDRAVGSPPTTVGSLPDSALVTPSAHVSREMPGQGGAPSARIGCYVFTREGDPRPSTIVIADRPTVLPSSVRDAYEAARDSDGTMLTRTWLPTGDGRRAMVLPFGEVVFEQAGAQAGTKQYTRARADFSFPAPGQKLLGEPLRHLSWREEEVVPEADGVSFRPLQRPAL